MLSDRDLVKLTAQTIQGKKLENLSHQELELVVELTRAGYLRPASNGFVGMITSQAMFRDRAQDMVDASRTVLDDGKVVNLR